MKKRKILDTNTYQLEYGQAGGGASQGYLEILCVFFASTTVCVLICIGSLLYFQVVKICK